MVESEILRKCNIECSSSLIKFEPNRRIDKSTVSDRFPHNSLWKCKIFGQPKIIVKLLVFRLLNLNKR